MRRERRAARAKAERDAKLAEIKKKRQEAAEAAKRGEAPDLYVMLLVFSIFSCTQMASHIFIEHFNILESPY